RSLACLLAWGNLNPFSTPGPSLPCLVTPPSFGSLLGPVVARGHHQQRAQYCHVKHHLEPLLPPLLSFPRVDMDRHSGNGRGRGLALHVASRLRGIRRLALATSSRFTNCRFVFALSALA